MPKTSNPRKTSTAGRARRVPWWWYAAAAAVVVLVVASALVAVNVGNETDDTETDDGLAASFDMLDGGQGSLAEYRGQPLVMNFFASWCAPCLAEMPGFEQIHQDMRGDVQFLGMNLQDQPQHGQLVVEQTGVTYDVGRDPDGVLFTEVGGFAMPTTVFFDANGVIVDVASGELTAEQLRERIDEVLL